MNFQFPAASAPLLAGIPIAAGCDLPVKSVFDAHDKTESGSRDPSNCKLLTLIWSNRIYAVAWSAKLAVDADGSPAAPDLPAGTGLDPLDGQNETSYRFADGSSLSSALHPFLVIPEGEFSSETALKLGDLAVIIHGGAITAAVLGDMGPAHKLGEASIAVHEVFHDPCSQRRADGACLRIRDVSIEQDVIVIAFPGSAISLQRETAADAIREAAYALFAQIKGAPAQS